MIRVYYKASTPWHIQGEIIRRPQYRIYFSVTSVYFKAVLSALMNIWSNTFSKWSKNFDDRPHRMGISFGQFNVTIACFRGRPIGTLIDSVRGTPDARATGNSVRRRAAKSRRHPPSKLPLRSSHGGSGPTSNTWSLGPTRVNIPKGITISLPAFAGIAVVTDRPTDRQTTLLRLCSSRHI